MRTVGGRGPPPWRTAGPELPVHTIDTTQETLAPMAPERTAAAVQQNRPDPTRPASGDRASSALGWLLHRAGAWRDRLVGTSDAVDPAEDVEEVTDARGLVLRPALLGFVAVLAVAIGASMPSSRAASTLLGRSSKKSVRPGSQPNASRQAR